VPSQIKNSQRISTPSHLFQIEHANYDQIPINIYGRSNCQGKTCKKHSHTSSSFEVYLSSKMLLMYVPTRTLTGRTVNPRHARKSATERVDQLK